MPARTIPWSPGLILTEHPTSPLPDLQSFTLRARKRGPKRGVMVEKVLGWGQSGEVSAPLPRNPPEGTAHVVYIDVDQWGPDEQDAIADLLAQHRERYKAASCWVTSGGPLHDQISRWVSGGCVPGRAGWGTDDETASAEDYEGASA